MIAAITPREYEDVYNNQILFEVDETTFNRESVRTISRNVSIDGTAIITDWGHSEANRVITLDNVYLSKDDYTDLSNMKESTMEMYFHYLTTSWRMLIDSIRVTPFGDRYKAFLSITPSEKVEAENA